jgi:DNA-binding response OmpR family regulator
MPGKENASVRPVLGINAASTATRIVFEGEESLVRLRATTRRNRRRLDDDCLAVGDLVLCRDARGVHRAGLPIQLAPKEFALLEYFMRHPGQAPSWTTILERVWERGFGSLADIVDATIARLRKAVDKDFDLQLIHTVHGVGYNIKAP